jgi:hypothetical protein
VQGTALYHSVALQTNKQKNKQTNKQTNFLKADDKARNIA